MGWNEVARAAQERVISIFAAKPAAALDLAKGSARLDQGFTCTYSQDGHSVTMDMPEVMGGGGEGPSPGFYGRAGLTGCLAIGIRMSANREGIDINAIEVDVEQDFDNRGMFGVPGCPAQPIETRLKILIDSPAPAEVLDRLVARTLEHDPWYLAFRDSQRITTDLTVSVGS